MCDSALLIPRRVGVFGLPLTVPRETLEENVFAATTLRKWREWYDLDFRPLAAMARRRPAMFYVNPFKARGWAALSDGVRLLDVSLSSVRGSVFRETARATAEASGTLNGVLVYFEAELAPGVRLSTLPASVSADNHWSSPVWVLARGLSLRAGERFALTYTRNAPDAPDGVTVARPSGKSERI